MLQKTFYFRFIILDPQLSNIISDLIIIREYNATKIVFFFLIMIIYYMKLTGSSKIIFYLANHDHLLFLLKCG